MSTEQEQQLSKALHTAQPHPELGVDLSAVLAEAHHARHRRRRGNAVAATLGVLAVAAGGLWVTDVLPGESPGLTPASVSVTSAQETYGVETEPDSGVHEGDESIQRAGRAAQQRQYDCVESHGVTVQRFPDGSAQIGPVEGDTPGGPDQTHRLMSLCAAQAGFPEIEQLTSQQISELYGLNLAAVTCLEDHGHTPAPAVSEEEFIQDYAAALTDPDILRWTPYQGIDDPAAVEECPVPRLHS